MKNIIKLVVGVYLLTFTSCLKSGLDDLPVYDQAEMTNVKFEYRWWDESAKQMRVIELPTDKTLETDNKTFKCVINVPNTNATFTQQVRDGVLLSNIVATVDISTAARVKPLNGAPVLGTPSDFSAKVFRYLVTAADGKTKAEWTIDITDFKK